ncbi:MAG TPA: AAA family ATPase, partial [Pyrinomonadaceae bacterium]|nr:AAA family ATPase [Pyrinomonadaceae bacterium]
MLSYTPQTIAHILNELRKVIVGQDDAIEQILVAMLAEGHALIEGVPGTAKTLTIKTLARIIGAHFTRIQFTPDLMPSDVTGTNVFNMQTSQFSLRHGPIFTDILLADEINRTPPKTQAALLEAMEERQVTIDGERYLLSPLFTVLATENPIEYEGTYPLPEAQLDRFLLKIVIEYPTAEAELEIISRWDHG